MSYTFPTALPSGAPFEMWPLKNLHQSNAIQDESDSQTTGSRLRKTFPPRKWFVGCPSMDETDAAAIMSWLYATGFGSEQFNYVNPRKLWSAYVAPTLSQSAGGALAGRTLYVTYTWSDGTNETLESLEASFTVDANNYLVVQIPHFPRFVTGAKIYIGTSSGTLYYSGLISTTAGTWTEDDSATTVNGDSAAGQKILNVADETGFQVGGVVVIDPGGAREEWKVIAALAAGQLAMTEDLDNTHTAVQNDDVETVVGNANADSPPSTNTFTETIPCLVDLDGPSPEPTWKNVNTYSLSFIIKEDFP